MNNFSSEVIYFLNELPTVVLFKLTAIDCLGEHCIYHSLL